MSLKPVLPPLLLLLSSLSSTTVFAQPVTPARADESLMRGSDTGAMSAGLQAMQADPFQNPGMLFVDDGAARWGQAPPGGQSCQACHGDAAESMRGVATRYPRIDPALGRPVSLGEQIVRHLRTSDEAPPLPGPEDPLRLSLEAFVARQSLGLALAPDPDPRLRPFAERGAARWQQRLGQLDLSCAQCHDELAGGHLAGARIPQGHPTGYPIYRLEWQALGSLQRRLRNCLTGVRAEPFPPDAVEAVELELHLVRRAAGLPLETPAVRP